MAKLQISKEGQGTITIPKTTYKRKGWGKGTELDVIENTDGDLIIRESCKKMRQV